MVKLKEAYTSESIKVASTKLKKNHSRIMPLKIISMSKIWVFWNAPAGIACDVRETPSTF